MSHKPVKHISIFASGAGSNAQAIIDYFRNDPYFKVVHIFTNNKDAGVIKIAEKENIGVTIFNNKAAFEQAAWIEDLKKYHTDLVVLAGFLWRIPPVAVKAFANKIINLHPALLPKYGGKGMYGHHVHEQVLRCGDRITGITIHYVDEAYDEGDIIAQFTTPVIEGDNERDIAVRVQALEHYYLPRVIRKLLQIP